MHISWKRGRLGPGTAGVLPGSEPGLFKEIVMKQSQVTIEQFAHWGFEDDLKCGCFDEEIIKKWEDLDPDLKDVYLDEAKYYMDNKDDWPMEILLRLEDHGLSEQRIKEYKESGWR